MRQVRNGASISLIKAFKKITEPKDQNVEDHGGWSFMSGSGRALPWLVQGLIPGFQESSQESTPNLQTDAPHPLMSSGFSPFAFGQSPDK